MIPAAAVKELKFNAGGLKVGDFDDDPSSYVSGVNRYYRGPTKPGLSTGASHRWGNDDGFSYDLPLGDGVYDIDLIFAEVYPPNQKNGARVFDVSCEDDIKIANLDVFKEANGGEKEVTKSVKGIKVSDGSLTISFLRKDGKNNPMVSGLKIRREDGGDLSLDDVVTGEGTGSKPPTQGGFGHQSHAVAGGPYVETDFNNDGTVKVELDGTKSHSHYNNPDTGESGKIVKYQWVVGGSTISTKPIFIGIFKVGVTEVELTVTDQTGDAATAKTEVRALPSTAGGAYCYFYPGAKSLPKALNSEPKPVEGHSSNAIDFDDDEFQYTRKDDKTWAARCITDFASTTTKQKKFSVKYQGAGAELYVNGGLKISGGPSGDGTKVISKTVVVSTGKSAVQVLYYRDGPVGSLQLLVDDVIVTPKSLAFKSADIVPTISSISPDTIDPTGGGQMQITGTGMFNAPFVTIGKVKPTFTKISATEIVVNSIPTASQAGGNSVDVFVTNDAGVSNKVKLTYAATQKKGVAWEQTYLKSSGGAKYSIKQIAAIAVGPDSNYYMGSLAGYVIKVTAGKDLVVKGQCTGPNMGPSRAVLGVAFYHKSKEFRAYVSTSTMYWAKDGPFKNKVDGWANGAVESLKSGCGCLCYEKKVITGLPVSNHDHAVNAIEFLDNGDLLISVGGATNGGHNTPGNKLGGYPETPLSGAILIAKLSKGGGFNGNVKYNQYANPATSKQTGGDVSVYASGLRNCYGLAVLTNGQVWATDNGGNFGYGDVSKNCNENVHFSIKQYDEVNLIQPGKYYGHPNRNRGECVHSNFGAGEKPKKTIASSTPGIVEYTSNAFSGGLKGEIVLSKYAASGSGTASRYTGGDANPVPMAPYSGLRVINGLHGELIMPRVQQGFVAVLKPKYTKPSGPMVIAVSPRKGTAGNRVFVSGENFAAGLSVTFGGKAGTNVGQVTGTGFFVDVPGGSGKVSVVVTVGGASSAVVPGFDFIYL